MRINGVLQGTEASPVRLQHMIGDMFCKFDTYYKNSAFNVASNDFLEALIKDGFQKRYITHTARINDYQRFYTPTPKSRRRLLSGSDKVAADTNKTGHFSSSPEKRTVLLTFARSIPSSSTSHISVNAQKQHRRKKRSVSHEILKKKLKLEPVKTTIPTTTNIKSPPVSVGPLWRPSPLQAAMMRQRKVISARSFVDPLNRIGEAMRGGGVLKK